MQHYSQNVILDNQITCNTIIELVLLAVFANAGSLAAAPGIFQNSHAQAGLLDTFEEPFIIFLIPSMRGEGTVTAVAGDGRCHFLLDHTVDQMLLASVDERRDKLVTPV